MNNLSEMSRSRSQLANFVFASVEGNVGMLRSRSRSEFGIEHKTSIAVRFSNTGYWFSSLHAIAGAERIEVECNGEREEVHIQDVAVYTMEFGFYDFAVFELKLPGRGSTFAQLNAVQEAQDIVERGWTYLSVAAIDHRLAYLRIRRVLPYEYEKVQNSALRYALFCGRRNIVFVESFDSSLITEGCSGTPLFSFSSGAFLGYLFYSSPEITLGVLHTEDIQKAMYDYHSTLCELEKLEKQIRVAEDQVRIFKDAIANSVYQSLISLRLQSKAQLSRGRFRKWQEVPPHIKGKIISLSKSNGLIALTQGVHDMIFLIRYESGPFFPRSTGFIAQAQKCYFDNSYGGNLAGQIAFGRNNQLTKHDFESRVKKYWNSNAVRMDNENSRNRFLTNMSAYFPYDYLVVHTHFRRRAINPNIVVDKGDWSQFNFRTCHISGGLSNMPLMRPSTYEVIPRSGIFIEDYSSFSLRSDNFFGQVERLFEKRGFFEFLTESTRLDYRRTFLQFIDEVTNHFVCYFNSPEGVRERQQIYQVSIRAISHP